MNQSQPKLTAETDPGILLLELWLAAAPTDSEEICSADSERNAFLQDLNNNRIDSGERPLFPS